MSRINDILSLFDEDSEIYTLMRGAQYYAAITKKLQARWEAGVFIEEEQMHMAKMTAAFVGLVDACESEAAWQEREQFLTILNVGQSFTPAREVFIQVEPSLSQLIDEKYGPAAEYKWCPHGFVHGIDCPDGCKEGTQS